MLVCVTSEFASSRVARYICMQFEQHLTPQCAVTAMVHLSVFRCHAATATLSSRKDSCEGGQFMRCAGREIIPVNSRIAIEFVRFEDVRTCGI